MIKLPEPVSLLRCHTAQEAYHYTESQLKQAVRDAYEDAAKVAKTKLSGLGAEAAIRALSKEIK